MVVMVSETITSPAPPIGVIESVAQGFEMVAGRTVLLLLPLLLDLFIWVGPRISFQPLVETLYHQPVMSIKNESGASILAPEMEEMWHEKLDQIIVLVLGDMSERHFIVLPPITIPFMFIFIVSLLLVPSFSTPAVLFMPFVPLVGIPSLLATQKAQSLPVNYVPPVIEIKTLADLLSVGILGLFLGLILGSLYLTIIANQVRGVNISFKRIVKKLPSIMVQFFAFSIAIPLFLWMLLLPFIIMAVGINPLLGGSEGGEAGSLIILTGRMMIVWIGLFTFFTAHGILLNDRKLLAALWDSMRVVQWNIIPTIGLIFLILFINWAMMISWHMAGGPPFVTLLGIIIHAFISTGLITGTYIFYKDRYRYWKEIRNVLLAELERRQKQLS